ncbi:uncharacterized protein LOC142163507 [Nicotiana tabacum]|uniref:Uncharacterized protein LOC142163507 n=1 Tax=Nicotiana tabacum TaxID=4097 RepID=A0AC58RW00_TOBAC
MLIALCPRKLISCKLDLRVLSSPNSRNSSVALSQMLGRVKATIVGKGKGLKRKAPSQISLLMNFIIWNARGANSTEFYRHCAYMVKLHNLVVLFLLETRMADHTHLTVEIQLSAQFQSPTIGQYVGIVVMWKDNLVKQEAVCTTPHGVHATIKVAPDDSKWLFSAIYASGHIHDRIRFWQSLEDMATVYKGNWFVAGDFNEVLKARDKFGGNNTNNSRSTHFWNCLNQCRIVDLGFKRSKYTWSNKRYTNMQDLILEKLDRCFATDEWIELYLESTVTHLPRAHSNRCPLLITITSQQYNDHRRPFRFESMWCSHPEFISIVHNQSTSDLFGNTNISKTNVTTWNRHVFCDIFHKKKHILAKINGIQRSNAYPFSR